MQKNLLKKKFKLNFGDVKHTPETIRLYFKDC